MKCSICKTGTTKKGTTTVTLEKDNTIIIIKNVSANICSNCGEYYLDEKTASLVMQKVKEAVKKGSELGIIKLPKVA